MHMPVVSLVLVYLTIGETERCSSEHAVTDGAKLCVSGRFPARLFDQIIVAWWYLTQAEKSIAAKSGKQWLSASPNLPFIWLISTRVLLHKENLVVASVRMLDVYDADFTGTSMP